MQGCPRGLPARGAGTARAGRGRRGGRAVGRQTGGHPGAGSTVSLLEPARLLVFVPAGMPSSTAGPFCLRYPPAAPAPTRRVWKPPTHLHQLAGEKLQLTLRQILGVHTDAALGTPKGDVHHCRQAAGQAQQQAKGSRWQGRAGRRWKKQHWAAGTSLTHCLAAYISPRFTHLRSSRSSGRPGCSSRGDCVCAAGEVSLAAGGGEPAGRQRPGKDSSEDNRHSCSGHRHRHYRPHCQQQHGNPAAHLRTSSRSTWGW